MIKIARHKTEAIVMMLVLFLTAGFASADSDEDNNIKVYRTAGPGVVNITSIVMERDFFFNVIPREGAGSGSIIDKDGHIMTNFHVIQDSSKLEVTLSDGSKWPARFVGGDPDNDLAVIKIDAPKSNLTVLPLGDSENLQVGQKVLAIGNPFGLEQTLTTGIISSLGRSIRSSRGTVIEDLIQTDAAINPGNSGGPLLNSKGEIIGINTAIISPTGASVGIGFAVPVNTARQILPDLIARGRVSYPWLGATIYPMIPEFADYLGLDVKRGAVLAEIIRGGPAHKSGLRGGNQRVRVGNSLIIIGGDIITQVDDRTVDSSEELLEIIKKHRPGDLLALKVYRNGKFINKNLKLGERPLSY